MTVKVTIAANRRNNRYTCNAAVFVRDTATGKDLAAGVKVAASWSKAPDTSSSDGWPYNVSITTSQKAGLGVVATSTAKAALPATTGDPAKSCTFTVKSMTGRPISLYVIDKGSSVMNATFSWR
jgi:hypothetical protein